MSASRDKIWQSTDVALQKAVAKHQSGDLGAAAQAYRAILKRQPRHAATLRQNGPLFLNNFGLMMISMTDWPVARISGQHMNSHGETLPC